MTAIISVFRPPQPCSRLVSWTLLGLKFIPNDCVFIHLPGVAFLNLSGGFLPTLNKLAKRYMHLKGTRASKGGSRNHLRLLYSDSLAEWPGSSEARHRIPGWVECQFAKGAWLTLKTSLFIFHNVLPSFTNWTHAYYKTHLLPLQNAHQDTDSKPRKLHHVEHKSVTNSNSYLTQYQV